LTVPKVAAAVAILLKNVQGLSGMLAVDEVAGSSISGYSTQK
jgi:hypothetical protein